MTGPRGILGGVDESSTDPGRRSTGRSALRAVVALLVVFVAVYVGAVVVRAAGLPTSALWFALGAVVVAAVAAFVVARFRTRR